MHGVEFNRPAVVAHPSGLLCPLGPVGQTLSLAGRRPDRAVIGLGTGALACLPQAWRELDVFFEIDGAVEKLARDVRYFHYRSELRVRQRMSCLATGACR